MMRVLLLLLLLRLLLLMQLLLLPLQQRFKFLQPRFHPYLHAHCFNKI